jgi:hypothetical protein
MRFLNSKYFKAPVLILILIFILALLYIECVVNHNKDLDIFVAASRLVFDKQNCYDIWLHSGTAGLKYFYSPLFAVILFPLKDLPQIACNFIWLSLNLFLAYRIFTLIPFFLPLRKMPEKKKQLFYLLLILSCGRFFFDTFSLGQMTIILVWGSLESMGFFSEKKTITGSALLALIINVKIIPIALLGYLFYKGHVRAVLYTSIFLVIYLFLPGLFIGFSFNNELLGNWYASITSTTGNSIIEDYGRQSLSSCIPALLMDTPVKFGFSRNVVNLDPSQVNGVLNGVRLIFVIAIAVLLGKPFSKVRSRKELFYGVALTCLLTPLFFPHQGKYSFFYLVPAQAWCIYTLMRLSTLKNRTIFGRAYKTALLLVVLSFVMLTLTTDGLIGRKASDFCEYLQLITIGTICLFAGMVVLRFRGGRA